MQDRKQDLLKEIELIQSVITRMANTSFLIKGWTITMVTLVFTAKADIYATYFVFIPMFAFWFLDAYFLKHERLYRALYNWVIEHRMTNDVHLFSLNPGHFNLKGQAIIKVMFSPTLGVFYGMIFILIVAYILSKIFIFPV